MLLISTIEFSKIHMLGSKFYKESELVKKYWGRRMIFKVMWTLYVVHFIVKMPEILKTSYSNGGHFYTLSRTSRRSFVGHIEDS